MNKISTKRVRAFGKITLILISLFLSSNSFGQNTILFNDSFDPASSSWNQGSIVGENAWHIGACAGNGISMAGDTAAYVTTGNTVACGPEYAYQNATTGSSEIILSHTVDATCATANLSLSFDYQVDGDANDFIEAVYSTDGGSTWVSVTGGALFSQSTWGTFTNLLPTFLAGTSFELGFRFTYDDATITGNPAAIDNVVVTGVDNVAPVLICPTSDTIPSSPTSCESGLGKVNSLLFALSDNCTDSADLVVSQTPAISTILSGNLSSVSVTVTVLDEASNQSQCTFNVVLLDMTPPTPVCPPDTHQLLDINCETTLNDFSSYVMTNSTDNCTVSSVSQSPVTGTSVSGHETIIPVTMTVNDEAGNQSTCVFNVELYDSIAPTLNCPSTAPMYTNASCQGVIPNYTSQIAAAAHDSCSATGTITAVQDLTAGTFYSSNQVITYTVTDENNNSSTCSVTLVITDTIKPTIGCAGSTYSLAPTVNCSAPLPNYATMYPPVTSDNCAGPITVSQNPPAGTMISGINNYIYLIAKDAAGNKDSCSFVVNINDVTPPSIICPNDTVIPSDAFCQGHLIDFTYLATMSDNCTDTFSLSQNFTQNPIAGTLMTGTTPITVTLKAKDNSGNSATCTLQVGLVDVTAPTIDPIPSFNAVTDPGTCNFTLPDYASGATAHDNCTADGSIILSQNPISGTVLNGSGVHNIDIIAEDESGNKDTLTITFTVTDNSPPVVSGCPTTQTVYATSSCDAILGDFTGSITATDNCTGSGSFTITQSPAASSTINTNTTVTISVADESANNNNTCSFSVLFVDTIAPQLSCQTDTSIAVNASCNYNIPNLVTPTPINDNCDSAPTVTQSPTAGSASSGTTVVTLTGKDATGNITTCHITVLPITTPVAIISCAPDQTINAGTACDAPIGDYRSLVTTSATCGGSTLAQIPAPGTSLNTGNNIITIVVTDSDNNTDTCTFNLFISENVPPTITCPNDTSTCDPEVVYSAPVGTDNCLSITTQTDATSFTSGDIFPIGTTVLQYTVTDSSGNTASCTFNVQILDYPDTALTMPDFDICDTISTIISANIPSSGVGHWEIINGTSVVNNPNTNVSGVNNLIYGLNTFAWIIQSASCGSRSDTLNINVYQMPNPHASTIGQLFACGDTSIEISGNTPTVGYGMWYDVNGLVSFVDSSSSITTAYNLQGGWNAIVWSIGNGVCPVTTDTLNVYANQKAHILNKDSLETLCSVDNTISLIGNTPSSGSVGIWYFLKGTGFIETPSIPNTIIDNISYGNNLIIYRITNSNCNPTYDTAMVVVNDCNALGNNFPTMITPNGDGKNDLWVLENLDAIYPNCSIKVFNRWGNIVFESTGYKDPWDGTYKGKPLPMGAYFYVIETKGADNKVYKGNISIIY